MNIFYDDLFHDNYETLFNLDIPNIPRRYIRDAQDPYSISEVEFKIRYRFRQETVKNYILPLIAGDLIKLNKRGLPLAPELQILICLRFYATASFQIVCGDLLHVSQPAVSNIITKISLLLAQKHGDFIKYPTNITHKTAQRRAFTCLGQYNRHPGLRNIDGAIDCTHIKIVDTPGVQHHEVYRNRKSYFSINVQAVVGPSGEFINLVARWAGSTHDSRILQMSMLNMKYMQRIYDGILVGDSGYPCLPYLLTPVNSPTTIAEQVYNYVHARTRNIVERTFGMWKRRFPCLRRGLGNKLSTVSNIIVACAVLFNIGIRLNDEPSNEHEGINDVDEPEPPTEQAAHAGSVDGFAIRQAIINSYN